MVCFLYAHVFIFKTHKKTDPFLFAFFSKALAAEMWWSNAVTYQAHAKDKHLNQWLTITRLSYYY